MAPHVSITDKLIESITVFSWIKQVQFYNWYIFLKTLNILFSPEGLKGNDEKYRYKYIYS